MWVSALALKEPWAGPLQEVDLESVVQGVRFKDSSFGLKPQAFQGLGSLSLSISVSLSLSLSLSRSLSLFLFMIEVTDRKRTNIHKR